MTHDGVLRLERGTARAHILPREGGVATTLEVDGMSVLAQTPWHESITPDAAPAPDEDTWVRRWHGGWQLCFPTAGQPEPGADPVQGFHGAASQAPWSVVGTTANAVVLEWADAAGLRVRRRWEVRPDGLTASTSVTNEGPARALGVAEHLVLGSDVLAPIRAGEALAIVPAGDPLVAVLDYTGRPTGRRVSWTAGGWDRADSTTPPRVGAIVSPRPRHIDVVGPEIEVGVDWRGLEHALIWEEFGVSQSEPWGGAVQALGIEPTSTPHGAGTAARDGLLTLPAGERMRWSTRLRVRRVGAEPGEDGR